MDIKNYLDNIAQKEGFENIDKAISYYGSTNKHLSLVGQMFRDFSDAVKANQNSEELPKLKTFADKLNITIQDDTLDEIIDTAIDETIENEEIQKVIPIIENLEKEKEMPINDENILHKEIIENRGKVSNVNDNITKLRITEHNHFVELMKELHFLKKHYLKITGTTILVCTFAGYIAGTQHNTIAPYIAKVWDLYNSAKPKGDS